MPNILYVLTLHKNRFKYEATFGNGYDMWTYKSFCTINDD